MAGWRKTGGYAAGKINTVLYGRLDDRCGAVAAGQSDTDRHFYNTINYFTKDSTVLASFSPEL